MCAFWRELSNGGRRNVIIFALSVVAVIMKRRKKRRKHRKTWTRERIKNRTSFGAYYALFAELRNYILTHSQSSILIQPQFQSPCWILPPSRVTPNSKTIGGRRSTGGNLLKRNRLKQSRALFFSTTVNCPSTC